MNLVIGLIGAGRALVQEREKLRVGERGEEELAPELRRLFEARDRAGEPGRIGNGSSSGEGVFDFRYGPFTGGYPEAGIFHLHTYGEKILSVEVDISCKHRGIEASMAGLELSDCARASETVAGNFGFAHSLAFCRAAEAALELEPARRAERLRLVGLELERIYNHLLVKARLAQAAAQKVLAAHVEALFEEALRINKLFCGSRLLSGSNRVGGVSAELAAVDDGRLRDVAARVETLARRFESIYTTSLSSRNYMDRLHGIAVAGAQLAVARGLTGPSLRAAGVDADLRIDEPLLAGFVPVTKDEGDSMARMEVRAEEILASCEIVRGQVEALLGGADGGAADLRGDGVRADGSAAESRGAGARAAASKAEGLGAAESPSGTVAWWLETEGGRVARAYVSTPSLFGFQVFADALRGHIFTDFPFALDSFGLSFADAAR